MWICVNLRLFRYRFDRFDNGYFRCDDGRFRLRFDNRWCETVQCSKKVWVSNMIIGYFGQKSYQKSIN